MKLTKIKIIEAVEKSQGILTMAAQMLGVARQTLYSYIDRWNLRPLIDEQKQKLNDKVRYNIVKMINDGNEKVTLWYAERQMFSEFGNRQTVENINHNIDTTENMTDEEIREEIERIKRGI